MLCFPQTHGGGGAPKQELKAMSELLSLCTAASLLNFEVRIFFSFNHLLGIETTNIYSLSFLPSKLIDIKWWHSN